MKKLILVLYTLVFLLSATPILAANNRVGISVPYKNLKADQTELGDENRKKFVEFYVNGVGPITLDNSNSSNPTHFNLGKVICSQSNPSGDTGVSGNCMGTGNPALLRAMDLKDGDVVSFVMYMTDPKGQNSVAIADGTQIYDPSKNGGMPIFDQTNVDKSDRVLTPDQEELIAAQQAAVDELLTGKVPILDPGLAAKMKKADALNKTFNSGVKIPLVKVAGTNQGIYCDQDKKQIATAIGCIEATPQGLATKVLGFAIGIAGGITFLLMALGSIKLITAGGNPDSVQEGRTILTSAIAGLLVVVLSVFILRFFGVVVIGIPGLK